MSCEGEKRVTNQLASIHQSLVQSPLSTPSCSCTCAWLCPQLPALLPYSQPWQQPENARAPPCVGDSFSAVREVDFNSCLFAKSFCPCASLEERQPFSPKQKEQQGGLPTTLESSVLPTSHGEIASLSAGEKRDHIIRERSSWLMVTGRCPTHN